MGRHIRRRKEAGRAALLVAGKAWVVGRAAEIGREILGLTRVPRGARALGQELTRLAD